MQFIQLVEFRTGRPVNELRDAMDAWLAASRGKRTLQMAVVAAESDSPDHYWEILEFATEDDAAKSVALPETRGAYDRWAKLLDGEPVFHNLNVMQQFGGGTNAPADAIAASTPGAG